MAGDINSLNLLVVNVLHTFQKGKCYIFHCNIAFSSLQTVHVFTMLFFGVCIIISSRNLSIRKRKDSPFKMIPNMIGLVNRLLR